MFVIVFTDELYEHLLQSGCKPIKTQYVTGQKRVHYFAIDNLDLLSSFNNGDYFVTNKMTI